MQYHAASYADNVWDTFWYEKNLFGDIVAVYGNDGTKLISYTYDAWGQCSTFYHDGTTSASPVAKNPFRYRGYYYDSDLGLYYLQSRYYDSNTGRFISPDEETVITATPDALTDKNLYVYCDNNPIMSTDEDGEFWHLVVGAIAGVVSQYVSDVVSDIVSGKSIREILTPNSSLADYIAAGASGALAASGVGVVGSKIANAAIKGGAYVINSAIEGEDISAWELTKTMISAGVSAKAGINGAKMRGIYKRSNEVLKTTTSARKIAMYTSKKLNIKSTVFKKIGKTIGGTTISGAWRGLRDRFS